MHKFAAARTPLTDRGPLLLALVCAALAFPVAFSPAVFNDGDTSWHLAAGKLIIERGVVPRIDPFTFTFAGHEWVAHEWLAEVILAALYDFGGWAGLALLTSFCVGLLLWLIGREALRHVGPLPAFALVTGVGLVLMPFTLARPHVLAWPILACWTTILLRARERGSAPHPAAALLMLLWANMHGSFLLGLLLVGFFAAEAVILEEDRRKTITGWSLFGLASVAAASANPQGLEVFLFPVQVAGMESLPLIGEWRATDLRAYPVFGIGLGAAAVVMLYRRKKIPVLRFFLLAGLTYLAMAHVRHQAVLAIVGSLILVRAAGNGTRAAPKSSAASLGLIVAAIAALVFLRAAIPLAREDSASNPLDAIAAIPADLHGQPVLNSYAFGGPLILAGIRPYIDGRADMYGDEFMFHHRRLMQGDMNEFRHAAGRWGLKWTILSPLDPLSRRLDSEPSWRRIYGDQWAVIHVAE